MLCIEMWSFGLKFIVRTIYLFFVTGEISWIVKVLSTFFTQLRQLQWQKIVTSSSSSFIILSSFMFEDLKRKENHFKYKDALVFF